jgi:SAM-dependent methyltransferase
MSSGKPRPPGKQRRALSMARAPGRIERGGDPRRAAALAGALGGGRDAELAASVTHPLHSYPARMHPATARALVEALTDGRPGQPVLLDPFCGSGTTLVEGRYAGCRCLGVDANPLAVLIARAKTWTVPEARRRELARAAAEISAATLTEGKAARRAGYQPPPIRTPPGVDPRARDRAIRDWFSPHVRRELEFIAAAIDEVREGDAELADLLTVLLSSILYKVSKRASDTDASVVQRTVPRGNPARLFRQRADLLLAGLEELAAASRAPAAEVKVGDARALPFEAASVDAVVTSPPYAGTYDYSGQHQLRLDFLGIEAEGFAGAEIGARRDYAGVSRDRRRANRAWHRDLAAALGEMARVLRPGRAATIVLGDSVAGNAPVWADQSLRDALPEGLTVAAWAWQERRKLGRREHDAFGDRPKREHILWLERR